MRHMIRWRSRYASNYGMDITYYMRQMTRNNQSDNPRELSFGAESHTH
jgi:hypothetical protein